MYIAEYACGTYNNHATRRDRKLLLNKKEIRSLQNDTLTPGYTIVPLVLFIDDNGRAKLDIALCQVVKKNTTSAPPFAIAMTNANSIASSSGSEGKACA